ncbi:MAG: proline--tRNA ligase [Chitinivibrionales bacterium]|nr:proline--tRNA ligase [Chitinivibrionales bacterium]MBD3355779.1 proline--tRNA ligase [Chitinivibrionales bacterium]
MRWKNAFVYTLREDPSEAELAGHRLMLRAGMIKRLASGIYDYLPLGLRVIRKIEAIIREEMERCGAAELLMPFVVPAELWKESGRWNYYGPELLRFKDRKSNEFCLGPTHEEVIVDVARNAVRSYRDLPLCLYQIQSKFRDEVRPRYGLMRGREFIMKDAYSFHIDEESLDETYRRMHRAYSSIFRRCGLDFRPVEADSGTIGGEVTHEFHVLADSGEDIVVFCDRCEYAANRERAECRREQSVAPTPENAPSMEEVETPDCKTIDEVGNFLGISADRTIKTLVFSVNEGEYLVAACIRGDKELNEIKLRNHLGADSVEVPTDERLRADTDMTIGYLGPRELKKGPLREIVADYSVAGMSDAVIGANRENYHFRHAYPARDLQIDRYADLAFVEAGRACPRCSGGSLLLRKGIEVGQVFKLGRKYTESMKMTVLDEKGEQRYVTMGCYGIGIGRTAAAAIEQHHDKDGIVWPTAIAPYKASVLCLDPRDAEANRIAAQIHDELEARGIDVLLDDREERPGVKFKDADLIGFPIRVVVGGRGLAAGIVEIKARTTGRVDKVAPSEAVEFVVNALDSIS